MSLTVIGVVAQPADADVSGFGQRVFVPLQTGRIRLVGVRAPIELAIGADDAADASDLAVSASNVLRQRYPLAASTFSVRTYVGSGGPESILRALPQAAAGVRAGFLQTKHLVSQPAAPTHAARLQSATGLSITTT